MTATTINTKPAPTAEAIQDALELLKNLVEQKSASKTAGEDEKLESFFKSDVFKAIEAALKGGAEAKAETDPEKGDSEEDREGIRRRKHAADVADGNPEEEEDEADDNPFAGEYYWNPGPEWKTISLVAGGAALVGLGALLYKLFDD